MELRRAADAERGLLGSYLIRDAYRPPVASVGDLLQTPEGKARVDAISCAPIPWPCTFGGSLGGKPSPILHGDLVKAIRVESAQAVAYWWGVNRKTVSNWRRRLGVGRMTAGTAAIWRESADKLRG